MKTKVAIAIALVIMAASSLRIPSPTAKGTPYNEGYDHGCSNAKLMFNERYINQPYKDPIFHTHIIACTSEHPSVVSNIGDSDSNSSSLFKQAFAKGAQDAHTDVNANRLNTGHIDDIDCDSTIDPEFANLDYCNGYTKGYMSEANNLTGQ
jgi:hypothetical protein